MRRGDAKPRRAARLTTTANQPLPGARGLSPRAFRAKRRTPPRAKAKLSLGYKEKVMLPVAAACGSITTV
jgi:hypothetical protein